MNVDRRSFLRGGLALTSFAIVKPLVRYTALPRVVGDGVHDDAPGLNALWNGDDVSIETSFVSVLENGCSHVRSGKYFLGSDLILNPFRKAAIGSLDHLEMTFAEGCGIHIKDYADFTMYYTKLVGKPLSEALIKIDGKGMRL